MPTCVNRLRLPRYRNVSKTGLTDPVLYHYYPLVRYFLTKRLSMAAEILGDRRFTRLLDAGCGGGIFLPELASRCDELFAIDVHEHLAGVRQMLEKEGIRAAIRQASITATRFPDRFFDCVVSISVLEFLSEVGIALDEIARVTAPGGCVVLGFPGDNILIDVGYLCIRAPSPRQVHKADFRKILAEARKRFSLVRVLRFPAGFPTSMGLYFVCELSRP